MKVIFLKKKIHNNHGFRLFGAHSGEEKGASPHRLAPGTVHTHPAPGAQSGKLHSCESSDVNVGLMRTGAGGGGRDSN